MSHEQKKSVPAKEFVLYLGCVFLFTNLQGMVGGFRQKYLVDVLGMAAEHVGLVNFICSITGFVLSFFFAMIVDRAPKPGKDKFRPVILLTALPSSVFLVLLFWTPARLSELSVALMIAYQCVVTFLYNTSTFFTGTVNKLAVVMSSDHRERDNILSFRGISSAIGNSAPLVVVLVVGLLRKPGLISGEAMMYLVSAVLCAAANLIMLLVGMRAVKERIAYSPKKVNPLLGYRDILKNRYAWIALLSEFIKRFRDIATYMGVFLAAALLGDASKFILFGLPTGIGTFVGMLLVNALLKKLNSKQIYILSGIYSIIANAGAYATGALSFQHPGKAAYQVIFFAFLFLIGLQYGASNLLPDMFKSDILEDLEAKTHQRLEASLDFVVGIGSSIAGALAAAVAPMVLYGSSFLNFIHYQPVTASGEYLAQTNDTKLRLLLVYTMVQGVFMLLCAVPYFFYQLTGKRKQQVHEAVLAYRESITKELQP
ncbi:MAG: MFS transporter [Oscillospiraceae bacterium]|jgi:GPH family glycoside/pentoside/hexuronide:cation symporter|nr:MFS transporter [Oscillospiraceae bacterium]